MTAPLVTVRHDEDGEEIRLHGRPDPIRTTLDVHAEITFEPGQTEAALEAVDRLAADLRRQIADAAERTPVGEDVDAACITCDPCRCTAHGGDGSCCGEADR